MPKKKAKRGQRTHTFTVTVTFNRKCSKAVALREVKNEVHGEHYCSQYEEHEPDTFKVGAFRHAKVSA